jgi:hypothetical protein
MNIGQGHREEEFDLTVIDQPVRTPRTEYLDTHIRLAKVIEQRAVSPSLSVMDEADRLPEETSAAGLVLVKAIERRPAAIGFIRPRSRLPVPAIGSKDRARRINLIPLTFDVFRCSTVDAIP